MGRILAFDYGKKRTGIAVTDPLKIIPGGLTTVPTSKVFDFLSDYMNKESVESFVVGCPRKTDNSPSDNYSRVLTFVKKLKELYPQKEIILYDERFTSVLAHQTMIDSGLPKMKRQDKALVDEISATIILKDYMESKSFKL